MKIETLNVSDFQGIESASLQLGGLTMVYGANGAGKSSLGDAILYALTGIQARGRLLGSMIRVGGKALDVEVGLEGGVSIRRRRTSSTGRSFANGQPVKESDIPEMIQQAYGVGQAALSAALCSGRILELAPAALQDLLAGLSGASFDGQAIREALGDEVLSAARQIGITLPSSLDDFPGVAKVAEGQRQAAKRTLEAREADLERLPPAPKVRIDPLELAVLRSQRDEAIATRGVRDAAIRVAEAALGGMGSRVPGPAPAPAPDLAPLRQRREEAIATRARRAGADAATIERLEARLAEFQGIPEFTQGAELQAVEAELGAIKTQITDHRWDVNHWSSQATRLAADAMGIDTPTETIEQVESDLEDRRVALQAAEAEVTRLTRELREHARVAERLPSCGTMGACPVLPDTNCPLGKSELVQLGGRLADKGAKLEEELAAATTASDQAAAHVREGSERLDAARYAEAKQKLAGASSEVAALEQKEARLNETAGKLRALKNLSAQRQQIPALEQELATARAAAAAPAGEDLAIVEAEIELAEEMHKKQQAHAALVEAHRRLAQAQTLPVGADLEALDAAIRTAEEAISAAQMSERRHDVERQVTEAHATVVAADKVAKACGAKATPAALVGKAVSPFLDVANAALDVLLPGAVVSVETGGGLSLVVTLGDTILAPDQLSDGERTRLLYALQYAVGHLAGVHLLVLDRGELIDATGRRAVMQWVAATVASGIQIILLSSNPAPAAAPAGVVAYAMSAGQATSIPQAEAA